MKRRTFGLLGTTSLAALKLNMNRAMAQTAKDPALLTTTLTPMGSVRAGNADGSIPAWTGGVTTVPDGWKSGDYMPDLFASDQPIATVDSSNMAQHAAFLTDGNQTLMTKYGFSMRVFPTRRTAAQPQWVYDNTARNLSTAQLNPGGGRLGFTGGYGGTPFPIPDLTDPYVAGAQIIWNHLTRWLGSAYQFDNSSCDVVNGQFIVASRELDHYDYPYYHKNGNLANFGGSLLRLNASPYYAPPDLVGQAVVVNYKTDPYNSPNQSWELLNGQGRVRKAPEISFDTPNSYADGLCNYDESPNFIGSPEKYDWKYIGKQELYIPYNNNALYGAVAEEVHKQYFLDPDYIRWEKHRVWVLEATLHPGERNVLARRKLYIDEDTWLAACIDAWDAGGNLVHVNTSYSNLRPDVPGLIQFQNVINNLQTSYYTSEAGPWNEKANPSIVFYPDGFPDYMFDPQNMAASSQY